MTSVATIWLDLVAGSVDCVLGSNLQEGICVFVKYVPKVARLWCVSVVWRLQLLQIARSRAW